MILIFLILLGCWYYRHIKYRSQDIPHEANPSGQGDNFGDLLLRIKGRHDVAERLIAFEIKKAPDTISRTDAINAAIERFEYDNRSTKIGMGTRINDRPKPMPPSKAYADIDPD